jgi:hypothetical protein
MLMMNKVFPNLDAKNNNNRKIAILKKFRIRLFLEDYQNWKLG